MSFVMIAFLIFIFFKALISKEDLSGIQQISGVILSSTPKKKPPASPASLASVPEIKENRSCSENPGSPFVEGVRYAVAFLMIFM